MSNDYPLTLQDVAAFLAAKRDEDELGICFNAMYCLLSETLNWLYPEQRPWRVDTGSYAPYLLPWNPELSLNSSLTFLQNAFDYCILPEQGVVTKEDLRTYLEHLETNGRFGRDFPFTTRDLFPE